VFDDLEPQKQTKKLRPLDDMSVDELKEYIANLQAEIARVEVAMKAKQSHMAAMDALFKKPA
jgi:uncharacterized small protein (DUF1192 family)